MSSMHLFVVCFNLLRPGSPRSPSCGSRKGVCLMSSKLMAKVKTVPKTLTLVSLIAAICLVSVACHGNNAEGDKTVAASTDVMPLAARIDRLDGEVGVDRPTEDNTQNNTDDSDWVKASINSPVSVGSRVYVKDN